jgi:hypothetical protein
MHLPVSILGLCGALAVGGDVIRFADIANAECSLVLVGPFMFRSCSKDINWSRPDRS